MSYIIKIKFGNDSFPEQIDQIYKGTQDWIVIYRLALKCAAFILTEVTLVTK